MTTRKKIKNAELPKRVAYCLCSTLSNGCDHPRTCFKSEITEVEITLITKKRKLNNGGPSLKEVVATPEFQKKLKEFRRSLITKKK